MCHEYSQYYKKYNKKPIITEDITGNEGDKVDIVGGTKTKPKEFPHMVRTFFVYLFYIVRII